MSIGSFSIKAWQKYKMQNASITVVVNDAVCTFAKSNLLKKQKIIFVC